jgi:hypothetical protein
MIVGIDRFIGSSRTKVGHMLESVCNPWLGGTARGGVDRGWNAEPEDVMSTTSPRAIRRRAAESREPLVPCEGPLLRRLPCCTTTPRQLRTPQGLGKGLGITGIGPLFRV